MRQQSEQGRQHRRPRSRRVSGVPSQSTSSRVARFAYQEDIEPKLNRAVEDLRRGRDREASFQIIHRVFRADLLRFFRRRGLAPEEAEDLVQETFLGVANDIGGFRGEAPFRHWLFALASNCMRRYFRHRDAGKRSGDEVALESVGSLALLENRGGSVLTPLENTMRSERSVRLRRAAIRLPEAMRRCVLLRLEHDYGASEIGLALSLKPATVRVRLYRARRLLRDALVADDVVTASAPG